MFFEFVRTEQGWRVYWGVEACVEAKTVESRPTVCAEETVEGLILVESDALSPKAV